MLTHGKISVSTLKLISQRSQTTYTVVRAVKFTQKHFTPKDLMNESNCFQEFSTGTCLMKTYIFA